MSDTPQMSSGDPLGGSGAPKPFPPAPPQDDRNWWQKLPKWAQWTLGIFVGLVVLGALFGSDESTTDNEQASTTTEQTQEPTTTTASEPEPTPDPEVEVSYSGPDSARSDDVTLKGTVDPANARIRVDGKSVKVRNGRWSLPVTLSKHGDNEFEVVASRKGYVEYSDILTVTRELSAAERAEIRREKALARANARAVESAQTYIDMGAFSKQGLYEQLSSDYGEGFTEAEAQYAVDHVRVNWKKEAVQSARGYLENSAMSRDGLLEQLTSDYGEGFTYEEAVYAVNKVY
jgi:hypothetical protein